MPSCVTKPLQRLAGNVARVLKGKKETKSSSPPPSRCGRNISALVPASLSPKKRAALSQPRRRSSRVQKRLLTQRLETACCRAEKHALILEISFFEEVSKLAERLSTLSVADWVYCDEDMSDWFMKQHLGKRAGEPLESEPKRVKVDEQLLLESELKRQQKIVHMYDESRPLVRKTLSPAAKLRASKRLSLPFPASIVPTLIPYQEVVPTSPVPQAQSQHNLATTSLGESQISVPATCEQTAPSMEPATTLPAALTSAETALPDVEECEREEASEGFASDLSASTGSNSTNATSIATEEPLSSDDEFGRKLEEATMGMGKATVEENGHEDQQEQADLSAGQSTVIAPSTPETADLPDYEDDETVDGTNHQAVQEPRDDSWARALVDEAEERHLQGQAARQARESAMAAPRLSSVPELPDNEDDESDEEAEHPALQDTSDDESEQETPLQAPILPGPTQQEAQAEPEERSWDRALANINAFCDGFEKRQKQQLAERAMRETMTKMGFS